MVASDIRKEARASLKEKWGKGALITLVYAVITYAINWVLGLIPAIGQIAVIVVEVPIAYGILVSFMKLKRGEEVSVIDFLKDGFKSFTKAWAVTGQTILKVIVPIIVAIVCIIIAVVSGGVAMYNVAYTGVSSSAGAGGAVAVIAIIGYIVAIIWATIKGLYYVLSMMILRDNEDLSAKEIVEKSEEYMKGNRWSYVWLSITFIGWGILATCTLGIGLLWLIPYIQIAQIVFYEDKAGILNATAEKVEEVKEVEEN